MDFYKRPFLFITPLLILGVLLGREIFAYEAVSGLFIGFLATSIVLYFSPYQKIFVGCSTLAFISLGFLISNGAFPPISKLNNVHSVILEIEEVQQSNKNWNKAIGRVTQAKVDDNWQRHNESVLLFFNSPVRVRSQILVKSKFEQITNKGNPGEFDAQSYWDNKGVTNLSFVDESQFKILKYQESNFLASQLEGVREYFKSLISESFDSESSGLLSAILLGDKNDIKSETRTSFSNAGAMHVLAVSGLHIGILLFLLFFVLSKFPKILSKKGALIISVLVVWSYAMLTGLSPSVFRASLMFTILIGGQVFSKKSDGINTLLLSAFILLLINPKYLFDLGFQLSYLAVLGIILLYRPIVEFIYIDNKWLRKLWEGTAIGIAAQIMTFPLTLYHFNQFPNYFILSNVGVMLFAGVLLAIGLLFFALGRVVFLNTLLIILLGTITNGLLFFMQYIGSLPGAVATGFSLSSSVVILFYFLLMMVFVSKKSLRFGLVATLLLFAFVQFNRFQKMNEDHIIFFNSNQPVVAVKTGPKINCFYRGDFENAKRLLETYRRVYPGEIEYLQVEDQNRYELSRIMSLESVRDDWNVKLGNKDILLHTSYKKPNVKSNVQIDMPYLNHSNGDANLRNGSQIFPF